jgi:hypothetical protein
MSCRRVYKSDMSTRAWRQLICQVLIAAVVFAQTAVAAYGCSRLPGTSTAVQLHAAMLSMGGQPAAQHPGTPIDHGAMDDSGGMMPMVAGLCAGHCQFGNQSADHQPAPAPSPALFAVLYALDPMDRHPDGVAGWPAKPAQGSPPAADPPHAILHCCLRD